MYVFLFMCFDFWVGEADWLCTSVPVWADVRDVEDAGYAVIRIRADLLSEMAGVRSLHLPHTFLLTLTRSAYTATTLPKPTRYASRFSLRVSLSIPSVY